MSQKFEPDRKGNAVVENKEKTFAEKYMLGDKAGQYAIHGGGVPIRVRGVEGVVGVVVVSGLKQHEDHAVVVEGMLKIIEQLEPRTK